MTWWLLLDKKRAQDFYDHLPDKSRAIVRDHLLHLTDDPYPGSGADKEQLTIRGDPSLPSIPSMKERAKSMSSGS